MGYTVPHPPKSLQRIAEHNRRAQRLARQLRDAQSPREAAKLSRELERVSRELEKASRFSKAAKVVDDFEQANETAS